MASHPEDGTSTLTLQLSDEAKARLAELAARLNRSENDLIEEAILAMTDSQRWQDELSKGIAAADRGDLVDEDEVDAYWDARLAGKAAKRPG